jgi:hypothetical protein
MARLLCPAAFLLAFLIPGGSTAGQTSGRSSSSTSQSQALQVELTSTIRAKNAKVGDEVTARTVTALILPNQVVIPEGSKVIGHVTQASSGVASRNAAIAIQFDKFELKKQQTLRADFSIRSGAMFQRAAPPAAPDDESDGPELRQSPTAAPDPQHPANMTVGGITYSTETQAKQAQASTSGALQPPVTAQNGGSRGDIRAVAHGTLIGMPGVALQLDETSGAATFVSTNRKLELTSGLQLMLGVEAMKAPAPAAGSPPK